jgi:hypothetical protein
MIEGILSNNELKKGSRPLSYPMGEKEVYEQTSFPPVGSKRGLFYPTGAEEVCSFIFAVGVYKFSVFHESLNIKGV